MRANEHNGLAVWLEVDGEKLDENNLKRVEGSKKDPARIECYVAVEPESEYTLCVRLGRQNPYAGDFIAEPRIHGESVSSLHVRKRWHVTHRMETFFRSVQSSQGSQGSGGEGEVEECRLTFGTEDELREAADDDDEEAGSEGENGMIVVAISRGEIERIKPVRKRIRTTDYGVAEGTRKSSRLQGAGQSASCARDTAIGEEFTYDALDRKKPWVEFVFRVRGREHLSRYGLLDRRPAQQHPCQVSNTVKLKAEPQYDMDENQPPTPTSAPTKRSSGSVWTTGPRQNTYGRIKREPSPEDDVDRTEMLKMSKRMKGLEEANKRLQAQVEQLLRAGNQSSSGSSASRAIRIDKE